jgi:putative N6-adenine-specific DNA methylase
MPTPPRSPAPSSSAASSAYDCFAVAAPGLEALVASELRALGESPQMDEGGASWRGDAASLCRANVWLRTASRVIVRAAEFRARTFFELERHARKVPWERYLAPGRPARFRVTCRKSRLYHTEAIAERMGAAIEHRLGAASKFTAADESADQEREEREPEQLFVVRMMHDVCVVSADSSGALLHLRGYRKAVAKAPLRETLAAALVKSSGWRGDVPLVDPLCGSGTIPIEAALIARHIAPGIARRFACLDWPAFPQAMFASVLMDARARARPAAGAPIEASDRDAGAIEAARANAERAGVSADIRFRVCAISAIEPPPGPGVVVANPPYGLRVGERHEIRNLYAQLGHVLRRHCPAWQLAIFSPDAKLTSQLGFPMTTALSTSNGGIPVRIEVGEVPADPEPPRVYF